MISDCVTALDDFLSNPPTMWAENHPVRLYMIVIGRPLETSDHLGALQSLLRQDDHYRQVAAVICICAAYDHILTKFGPDPDEWEPALAVHDSVVLKTIAAQSALKTKQLIALRAKWAELRSGVLSPAAVFEFERSARG